MPHATDYHYLVPVASANGQIFGVTTIIHNGATCKYWYRKLQVPAQLRIFKALHTAYISISGKRILDRGCYEALCFMSFCGMVLQDVGIKLHVEFVDI